MLCEGCRQASRALRKYGFKIVYALGDGNAQESAAKLAGGISHPAWPVSKDRMIGEFLPNVKVLDDISLLN